MQYDPVAGLPSNSFIAFLIAAGRYADLLDALGELDS